MSDRSISDGMKIDSIFLPLALFIIQVLLELGAAQSCIFLLSLKEDCHFARSTQQKNYKFVRLFCSNEDSTFAGKKRLNESLQCVKVISFGI